MIASIVLLLILTHFASEAPISIHLHDSLYIKKKEKRKKSNQITNGQDRSEENRSHLNEERKI